MLDAYLFIASILLYGFGKLNDSLPITVSNGLILACFLYHAAACLKKGYLYYNVFLIKFFAFILISTLWTPSLGSAFDKTQFLIYYFIYSFTAISVVKKHGAEKLLKAYLMVCLAISVIAIIQVIGNAIGLHSVNDILRAYSENKNSSFSGNLLRATSIASEPALLGIYLLPALVIAIFRILKATEAKEYASTKQSLIIIFSALLTFSLIVYTYLAVIAFIATVQQRNFKALTAISIFLAISYTAITHVESVNSRISEITSSSGLDASENLSVIALNSNIKVTSHSLSDNLFIGTGIASHSAKFDSVIGKFYSATVYGVGLNKDDAASMILRILSELGIIGFALYYSPAFLYPFRKNHSNNNFAQIIFLTSFILYGIRYGSINTSIHWFYLAAFIACYSSRYGLKRFNFTYSAQFRSKQKTATLN